MIRTFTLRYTDELRSKLQAAAKRRGWTVNGLILSILWDWLKQNDKLN